MKWALIVIAYGYGGNPIPDVTIFDTESGCKAVLEMTEEMADEESGLLGSTPALQCREFSDNDMPLLWSE